MKPRYFLAILLVLGMFTVSGTASAHDSFRPSHYGYHGHYKHGHGYRDYRHHRRHYYRGHGYGHRHHARCGHPYYYHHRRHGHYRDGAWIQFGFRLD